MFISLSKKSLLFISLLFFICLTGCSRSITSTYDDAPNLKTWAKHIQSLKPKTKKIVIPHIEKKPSFSYKEHIYQTNKLYNKDEQSTILNYKEKQQLLATKLRNPFELPYIEIKKQGPKPNKNRPKQPLESYSLNTLTMVGTIKDNNTIKALISSPDNIVYKVSVGQYMGTHNGKIISITPDKVFIQELLPNGNHGWTKKKTHINIKEY